MLYSQSNHGKYFIVGGTGLPAVQSVSGKTYRRQGLNRAICDKGSVIM